jgi:hypothetical protein
MISIEAKSVNEAYVMLLREIVNSDLPFEPSRVGDYRDVGVCCITLPEASINLVDLSSRGLNPFFALIEACWILAGREDLRCLELAVQNYGRFSDDGVRLNGAYGHRLRHAFAFDQIREAIEVLGEDCTSRRVCLSIYRPSDLRSNSRDIPCNTSAMIKIRNGRLDFTTINRSNDAYLGVPYDIFAFSMLHWHIAQEVGVSMGTYCHFSNCMHLYERDLKRATEIVSNWHLSPRTDVMSKEEGNEIAKHVLAEFDKIARHEFHYLRESPVKSLFVALADFRRTLDVEGFRSRLPPGVLGRLAGEWVGRAKS